MADASIFDLPVDAWALACPLIAYDERILQFGSRHGRQYGFSVTG
jgi:hypothetical protein